jgi:hypothetical protein
LEGYRRLTFMMLDADVVAVSTLVPEAELDQAEALLKDNLTPVANAQLELIGRLTA